MASLNVAQLLQNKDCSVIDVRYELKSDALQCLLDKNEGCPFDMIGDCFCLGYIQGQKAAKAEMPAGKTTDDSGGPVGGHPCQKNNAGAVPLVPVVYVPAMSDYQWKCECLHSRLTSPELYAAYENIQESIEQLRRWIADFEMRQKAE